MDHGNGSSALDQTSKSSPCRQSWAAVTESLCCLGISTLLGFSYWHVCPASRASTAEMCVVLGRAPSARQAYWFLDPRSLVQPFLKAGFAFLFALCPLALK